MLCVSSVVLLSSKQYRLECDLEKFGEISMPDDDLSAARV